jgi:diguanylate cyclase (GGDEF)-like protein
MKRSTDESNILIVDDTPENLTVLRLMLKEHGYRARPALSGEIALKAAQVDIPDLILLDIMMPGMNGFEVCKKLKANEVTCDIPVLFFSALNETEDKVKGFKAGGVDFITKPFHTEEVLARVETHLTLRHLHKNVQKKNIQLQNEIEERKRVEKALEKANRELEQLASLDGLTHIANRRQFDATLAREWKRLSRDAKPLSLIICDIDFFKKYNDTYGHVSGDDCLIKVAEAITSAVHRPADMVARYGGEEFAVIIPETDLGGAVMVAEKIRKAVTELAIPHANSEVAPVISLSLGVTAMAPEPEKPRQTIILCADELLYQAKATGRNRVAHEKCDNETISRNH